jgi:predicted PurR-regulated permease PerM
LSLKNLSKKKWYTGAVIACIGVAFYVLLSNIGPVLSAIGGFLGNFKAVFLAFVFAYLLNPLARLFYFRLFSKSKLGKTRWALSVGLAVLTALVAVTLLLGMLIPQLVRSITLFSENFDGYAATLGGLIESGPLQLVVDDVQLQTLTENAMGSVAGFVSENAGRILNAVANSGKGILTTVIALILAVYILLEKNQVMGGFWRLMRALLREDRNEAVLDFVLRCDTILVSYLAQTLLDALIIASANAIFMLVCGMQYVGLVSVVVGVTNLVPNFGPIIGAVIGGFVLLLVNPTHALIFLLFCVALQFVDAYILKPKLFSNSLGVSGLLILIATIVLGNMFGVWGMLLSIPSAAILSFLYRDYFLPRQELRRQQD